MRRVAVPLMIIFCLFVYEGVIAQMSANPACPDTTASNLTSIIGGDLFLTGEGYTLHFGRVGFFSLTGGGGLGVEMRVRPVFVGFISSVTSHEMRPSPSGPFLNSSFYVGAIIEKYRLEIGEMHGTTFMNDPHSPDVSITSCFLGLSRRYGSDFFAEPEVKIIFPIVAGYYQYGPPDYRTHVITEHYGIHDLFFAIGVKIGIGYN
jgi:hypothetical protein